MQPLQLPNIKSPIVGILCPTYTKGYTYQLSNQFRGMLQDLYVTIIPPMQVLLRC